MSAASVVGVILAGGLSRRMGGGDKALLELGGEPILQHVIDRMRDQVDHLVLNANGAPERFARFGLPVVPDPIDGFAGPLAGVLAGLDWAADNVPACDWIVSAASDTPFLPRDLVARFVAVQRDEAADLVCAASNDRHHPVFGLWPVRLRDDLRRAVTQDEIRKVDIWTAQHRLAVAAFSADPYDPFFNANRPDDLDAARDMLELADA